MVLIGGYWRPRRPHKFTLRRDENGDSSRYLLFPAAIWWIFMKLQSTVPRCAIVGLYQRMDGKLVHVDCRVRLSKNNLLRSFVPNESKISCR